MGVRGLVCALSTLSQGSVREKLEMCFSLYDLDDSRYVLYGYMVIWWGVWGCGGRVWGGRKRTSRECRKGNEKGRTKR